MKKRRVPWQFISTIVLAGAVVVAILKGQVVGAIIAGVILIPNASLSVLCAVWIVRGKRPRE